MEIDLRELLESSQELVIFMVIGAGYLLGRRGIGRLQLGPTAGVLFAGLLFGHLGFSAPAGIETVGFILFIYSVGYQAGPRFFSVFLEDGSRYLSVAVLVAGAGVALAVGFSHAFGLGAGTPAGLLAGALTSTPTLAAAQDAVRDGLADLPAGVSPRMALSNVLTSYAITYVFGLVGLLLLVRLLPRALGLDLAAEAARLGASLRGRAGDPEKPPHRQLAVRAFEVATERVAGHPVGEVEARAGWRVLVQKLKRHGREIDAARDTVIELGDRVSVVGFHEAFEGAVERVGPEVFDRELVDLPTGSAEIVVTQAAAAGVPLRELRIPETHGCFVTRLTRLGIELPIGPDSRFEHGDVVVASGTPERLEALGRFLGTLERDVAETDLLTFALGICAGLLVGGIVVKVGGVSLGLGTAGGLLVSGLLVGFLRSLNPTFGRVPPAARFVFMELGLLFFMAGVGLRAGDGIVEAVRSVGPALFVSGVCVTVLPVLVGYAFGRMVLGINPVLLLGALTGSMTSTPALNILCNEARSALPALGYTGAYAFANVLLTLAGTFMVRF